jgi:FAD synthetase
MTKGNAHNSTLKSPFFLTFMDSYTSLGSTYNTYRNPALRVNTAINGAVNSPKSSGTIPDVSKLSVLSDSSVFCEPSPGTVDAFYMRYPKGRGAGEKTTNGTSASTNGTSDGQLGDTRGLIMLASNPDTTCSSDSTTSTYALSNGSALTNDKSSAATGLDEGGEQYLPAYELKDGSLERLGRGKRPPTVVKAA